MITNDTRPPNYELRFTSPDQVRPGLVWSSAALQDMAKYDQLWRNVKRDVPVQFNWYRRITSFWVDALWGRPPEGTTPEIATAFDMATMYRSVKGYGVVLAEQDGMLRAIDPANWHRITLPTDRDAVIGHIVSYFWKAGQSPNGNEVPDMVDCIVVDAAGNGTRRTYQFKGSTLGQLVMSQPANIRGVVWWGDGISDYRDVKPVIDEIETVYKAMKRVGDRHADPHMQGPETALNAAGVFNVPSEGSAFLPLSDDSDHEFGYLELPGAPELQTYRYEAMFDQLTIMSSIPATAFGLEDTASQSGVSRERQLFTAVQKLRKLRREQSDALNDLLPLLGMSSDVMWPDHVFDTFGDIAQAVAPLVTAGILSTEDAAAQLNQ